MTVELFELGTERRQVALGVKSLSQDGTVISISPFVYFLQMCIFTLLKFYCIRNFLLLF